MTVLFRYGFFVMALWLTSCSPVVYSTTGQNVPLLHEKNEIAGSIAYAQTDNGEGVALQGAVAATGHLAVIASFYALSGGSLGNDIWKGRGSYFEAGAGYYSALPKNPSIIVEGFAGIGFGSIKNRDNTGDALNASFIKSFLQPSLGFRHRIVEIAVTPRIGLLHYTSNQVRLSDPAETMQAQTFFRDKKTSLVFEPGATVRLGYKGIKFQFQYNFTTFDTQQQNGGSQIDNEYISLGAHFILSKYWPGKKRVQK